VPPLTEDRPIGHDVETVASMIEEGALDGFV
jgi:hypothetical protein